MGSGYGKCVLHFAVENQLRRAAGIECVIARHEIATQVMQELHGEILLTVRLAAPAAEGVPGTVGCPPLVYTNGGAAPAPPAEAFSRRGRRCDAAGRAAIGAAVGAGPFERVDAAALPRLGARRAADRRDGAAASEADADGAAEAAAAATPAAEEAASAAPTDPFAGAIFHYGDATLGESLDFTHVYTFDRVFSDTTLRALAGILMRSPFYVLVSYKPCSVWWAHGLRCVQPVAKMRVQTTGKETMNLYIYVNMKRVPEAAAPRAALVKSGRPWARGWAPCRVERLWRYPLGLGGPRTPGPPCIAVSAATHCGRWPKNQSLF